jgi:stage II sporulation protein AA (anti-sigma F factor antagonist)
MVRIPHPSADQRGMVAFENSRLKITVEGDHALRVIRPEGELDIATVVALAPVVERECSSQADLIVDLSRLSFLDCTGLRTLLYARALADRNGSRLRLVPGPASVRRIFHLAGLDSGFDFVPPSATRRFQRNVDGSPAAPATDPA